MKKMLVYLLALVLSFSMLSINVLAALPEGVPSTIEPAIYEKIEIKTYEDGAPYFHMEVKIPQSILDLDKTRPTDGAVLIDYFWSIDNGEWEPFSGGYIDVLTSPENTVPGKVNTFYDRTDPIDEGGIGEIDIKSHVYKFKVQLSYRYYYGEGPGEWDYIYSAFSNVVSIGTGSFYSKASEWAKPELQKANDLGLIPEILVGSDMTKTITREEFCELAILLYEKMTGNISEPVSPNPFKDTQNPQILKAFKLGITAGTSATTFTPNQLITREQCAAMLFRAIKLIKPEGDFSVAGVKDFPDQKLIAGYAIEAAKYMSKIGIIVGDSQGNFMPKATSSAQEATGYGMALRQQAIAMSVRTYEKLK